MKSLVISGRNADVKLVLDDLMMVFPANTKMKDVAELLNHHAVADLISSNYNVTISTKS